MRFTLKALEFFSGLAKSCISINILKEGSLQKLEHQGEKLTLQVVNGGVGQWVHSVRLCFPKKSCSLRDRSILKTYFEKGIQGGRGRERERRGLNRLVQI